MGRLMNWGPPSLHVSSLDEQNSRPHPLILARRRAGVVVVRECPMLDNCFFIFLLHFDILFAAHMAFSGASLLLQEETQELGCSCSFAQSIVRSSGLRVSGDRSIQCRYI